MPPPAAQSEQGPEEDDIPGQRRLPSVRKQRLTSNVVKRASCDERSMVQIGHQSLIEEEGERSDTYSQYELQQATQVAVDRTSLREFRESQHAPRRGQCRQHE